MNKKVIEIKDLNFAYNDQNILEKINLVIEECDYIGIVGPNGGGKTTLLKLISGLLKPKSGSIKVLGMEPEKVKSKIGYVPQFGQMEKDFPIKASDVVAMGNFNSKSFFPWKKKNEVDKVKNVMEKLEIFKLKDQLFDELSGGQKQRCLIARALISKPEIILLDEPTASVDSSVEKDIFELLKEINKDKTIILVSHDIGFISSYVNKIACINKSLECHNANEVVIDDSHTIKNAYSNEVDIIKHRCGL